MTENPFELDELRELIDRAGSVVRDMQDNYMEEEYRKLIISLLGIVILLKRGNYESGGV